MAWRLEHSSSDAPARAILLCVDGFIDAVDARANRKVWRRFQRLGNTKRMRCELHTSRSSSERDVHPVVDDQPASGGFLSRRKEHSQLVKFAP